MRGESGLLSAFNFPLRERGCYTVNVKKPDGSPPAAPSHGPGFGLVILSAMFLCGTVAGCMTVSHVGGQSGDALVAYLQGILSASGHQLPAGALFWNAFVNAFKYHAVIFLLGLTLPGIALIPVAMAVRGFSLSFAVAAFVRAFGPQGILLSLGAFGVQALLTIPCLFILAETGLYSAVSLLGAARGKHKKPRVIPPAYFLRFALFAVILTSSALFEALAVPPIMFALAGRL